MKKAIEAGERDYSRLAIETVADLRVRGWHEVDYVETRNALTLKPASSTDKHLVILIAARLGSTRLIDNMEIHLA